MKNLTADLSLKSQFFYKHEDKDDMDRFLGPQMAKVKHGHIYPSFVFRLNEDDDQNKKQSIKKKKETLNNSRDNINELQLNQLDLNDNYNDDDDEVMLENVTSFAFEFPDIVFVPKLKNQSESIKKTKQYARIYMEFKSKGLNDAFPTYHISLHFPELGLLKNNYLSTCHPININNMVKVSETPKIIFESFGAFLKSILKKCHSKPDNYLLEIHENDNGIKLIINSIMSGYRIIEILQLEFKRIPVTAEIKTPFDEFMRNQVLKEFDQLRKEIYIIKSDYLFIIDQILKHSPSLLLTKNNKLKTKEFIMSFYSPLSVLKELDEIKNNMKLMAAIDNKDDGIIDEGKFKFSKVTFY
jgi:hypothetical protein